VFDWISVCPPPPPPTVVASVEGLQARCAGQLHSFEKGASIGHTSTLTYVFENSASYVLCAVCANLDLSIHAIRSLLAAVKICLW